MEFEFHIADDNEALRSVMARQLQRVGLDPVMSADGAELVARLSTSNSPVALLIDMNMPHLDGIGVLGSLMSLERRFRLRFMTGAAHADALAAQMMAKVRDVSVGRTLHKPVDRATLLKAVVEDLRALGLEDALPDQLRDLS